MKRLFGIFAVVAMAMVIVMFAVNVNATIGDRNTHQPNINPQTKQERIELDVARELKGLHYEVWGQIKVINKMEILTTLITDKKEREEIAKHLSDAMKALLQIETILLKMIAGLESHTINYSILSDQQKKITELENKAIDLVSKVKKILKPYLE